MFFQNLFQNAKHPPHFIVKKGGLSKQTMTAVFILLPRMTSVVNRPYLILIVGLLIRRNTGRLQYKQSFSKNVYFSLRNCMQVRCCVFHA